MNWLLSRSVAWKCVTARAASWAISVYVILLSIGEVLSYHTPLSWLAGFWMYWLYVLPLGSVSGLVVLRLHAGPLRAAELLGEVEHPLARAVGVAGDGVARRDGWRRGAEGARVAPAVEDQVDLGADLDVAAEVRHVDGPRLAGGRRRGHTAGDRRRRGDRQAGQDRRRLTAGWTTVVSPLMAAGLADRVHDRRLVVREGRRGRVRRGRVAPGCVGGEAEGCRPARSRAPAS